MTRALLALLVLSPLAAAEDLDKDTLDGMDAEVRGNWVAAAQAFARAAEAAPGDTRRSLRLRYARQRAMAIWKPQIDALMKEKRLDDVARVVQIAALIDPGHATVAAAGRAVEKAGIRLEDPPADEPVSPHFPRRSVRGRIDCWATIGPPFGAASRLIDGGNRFLVGSQEESGLWDSDKHGGGALFDTGVTGLALLALLVDGPGGLMRDREAAARKAVDALIKEQKNDGVIGTRATHSFIYCTVLATEALAEYALVTGDTDRVRPALERARDFIVDAQASPGGWRYDPGGGEADTSITGRAVVALRRVKEAKIDVPDRTFHEAMRWIDSMVEPNYGQIGYNYPGGAPARPEGKQELFPPERSHSMTAAGVLATCYMGAERSWLESSLALLAEIPPDGRCADMYYWQLGARAFMASTGSVPPAWYAALADGAAACAKPDGGMAACDVWGADGGRIYATAITVLALAAPFTEPLPPGSGEGRASAFLRSGSRDVLVSAMVGETATGIYADAGMSVTFTVRGTIQPWEGSPKVASDGIKHRHKSYKPILKSAPFACLLGRVGTDGKPFRIQAEKPFTLSGHGQLFLLVNDERPEDGNGAWGVRVALEK